MRVLFVVPPYRTTDALVAALYPMPLAAAGMAAVLQHADHQVAIKDFLVPAQKHKCKRPDSFKGLGAPRYAHYGQPLEDCKQWLRDHVPEYDVVGLCLGQCNVYETGFALAKYITTVLDKPLVVGGPYATTAPHQVWAGTYADVIVTGEGENICVEAFRVAIARHRKGYGKIILEGTPVEDLDALPLPAWEEAPPCQYPKVGGKIRGVLAVSRGCPHACTFCSVHTIHGRRHRRMSVDRITYQLQWLWAEGCRYLCFLDDNLFMSEDATVDLLAAIAAFKATTPGAARAKFYVEEGIEVRTAAKPGLLHGITQAGFTNVGLGLETMNDARRKAVRKPYTQSDLEAALAEAKAAGITPRAFYIVGLPGDTLHSVAADLVRFGKLGLAARPNNLKLYPGTEVTKQYLREGNIQAGYDWRRSSWHTPSTFLPGLSYKFIKKLKTILGAMGTAAEEFGIALLADSPSEVKAKLQAKGHQLKFLADDTLMLIPKTAFYRPTPYAHMVGLLAIWWAAADRTHYPSGVEIIRTKVSIVARPLAFENDRVYAAIARAMRRARKHDG